MFSIHSSIVDTVVDVQWLMSRCSGFKIMLEPGKLGTAAHLWAPHEIVQDRVPRGGSISGTWVIMSRSMTGVSMKRAMSLWHTIFWKHL